MSWALRIAGDAIADLRSLDFWLQEEVLDEIDRLCHDPPRPRPSSRTGEIIRDFERTSGGVRQVVFLRLTRDEAKETLMVLGIAAIARPESETG